jgi:hypothetical protein
MRIENTHARDTFEAVLDEYGLGMLWLTKSNGVTGKSQGRYLLNAVLTIGGRIVDRTPAERALLEAHGLGSGRVQ